MTAEDMLFPGVIAGYILIYCAITFFRRRSTARKLKNMPKPAKDRAATEAAPYVVMAEPDDEPNNIDNTSDLRLTHTYDELMGRDF